MADEIDVAIVGGGAAGIAAGRRLMALGKSVRVIEALPRLGGRAHTETIRGLALDLGCGWLHSAERNPLAEMAAADGLTLDKRKAAWRTQLHDINAPPEGRGAAFEAYEAFRKRLHDAPPASDRAADALEPDSKWRGFIDGLSSFINGAELGVLSIADFLAYEDASGDENWRLKSGYGAFIAALGADLPVALSTPVEAVRRERGVVVETDRGTIRAKAVIVAAPTPVLGRGDIRFDADVDEHLHAASCLPLGLADKVFLSMADPDALPPESHLLGRFDSSETGSYYIRPMEMPVIECFLGGAMARTLEADGERAAASFVVEELRGLLGADVARGLEPIAVTSWGREATIGGSYSHALPGHADKRAKLAAPVDERLCFAGEACSLDDFSTAHGAWKSGIAAADWIAQGL